MIKTKQDLKDYISSDNNWYMKPSWKWRFIESITAVPYYMIKKYLRYLRIFEYHYNNSKGSRFHTYLAYYYERRKNILGYRLGIEIGPNCFGRGLSIWHGGSIVVNPGVVAGENCILHGANCIGNNGTTDDTPILGDNVELGYGAVVIGNVRIANNVRIGANAVVNCSIEDENCTFVGVPARMVRPKAQGINRNDIKKKDYEE